MGGTSVPSDHPAATRIPEALLKRAADKGVLLTQVQAEAIGRLQLIQLVGLEIEPVGDEIRSGC